MPSEKSSDEETFFAAMQDVTPIKQGDKVLSIKGSACEQKRNLLLMEKHLRHSYFSVRNSQ